VAVVAVQAGRHRGFGLQEGALRQQVAAGQQVVAGVRDQVLPQGVHGRSRRLLEGLLHRVTRRLGCLPLRDRGVAGEFAIEPLRHVAEFAERLRAAEDAGQRVVVALADRVELVVVAARTAERQAEERAADEVDLFVDRVEHQLLLVLFGQHARAEGEEAGGDMAVEADRGIIDQQVAGDLHRGEAIERHVAGVRLHDPVAVAPAVGEREVLVEAVAVAVAGEVEPVAGLVFGVVHAGEQAVDDLGERVGGRVGNEGTEFGRSRRQAGQHERSAPQQGAAVGAWVGRDAVLLQAREHQPVDRVAVPLGVGNGRDLDGAHRPKRPVDVRRRLGAERAGDKDAGDQSATSHGGTRAAGHGSRGCRTVKRLPALLQPAPG
jgi:hypothetical protein